MTPGFKRFTSLDMLTLRFAATEAGVFSLSHHLFLDTVSFLTKSSNFHFFPFQRSKTKGESMHFPSNLNVEEFLSKLQYEDK